MPAVRATDVMGMRVTAEPALRLEESDVVGTGEEVGSGRPETPAPMTPTDGRRAPAAAPGDGEAEPMADIGPLVLASKMSTFV